MAVINAPQSVNTPLAFHIALHVTVTRLFEFVSAMFTRSINVHQSTETQVSDSSTKYAEPIDIFPMP